MNKAENLRNTWRIIAGVIIGQLIGLAFGFLVNIHPEPFLSLLVSGAVGTLPGFIFGLLWYFVDIQRRKKIPYFTVGFFALGSIVLPITAFQLLTGGFGYMSLVNEIKNIPPSSIKSLTIYEGYDNKNAIRITNKEKIYSFISACSDLKNDYVQHNATCNKITEYFISFNGALPKDMILEYCQSNVVKGVFAIRKGGTTTFHGTFSSVSLKGWLTENVVLSF